MASVRITYTTLVYLVMVSSAPAQLAGADTQELQQKIADVIDTIPARSVSARDYSLIIGSATVGATLGTVGSLAVTDYLVETLPRTREPFTLLALAAAPGALQTAITVAAGLGGSLLVTWAVQVIKRGIEAPFAQEVKKISLENEKFKKAVLEHQQEFETYIKEETAKRHAGHIQDIKEGVQSIFEELLTKLDSFNHDIVSNLETQQERAQEFRAQLSPDIQKKFDEIMLFSKKTQETVRGLHQLPHDTLKKYHHTHKNIFLRVFHALFGKKN